MRGQQSSAHKAQMSNRAGLKGGNPGKGRTSRLRGQWQLRQAVRGSVAGASAVPGGAENQEIRVFVQNLLPYHHGEPLTVLLPYI